MRLFESKDARERRLYREAYVAISRSLAVSIQNQRQRDVYLSWFAAASAMAEEIALSIACLRKTTDTRDPTQATRICHILALPMASVWFRSLDHNVAPGVDEKHRLRIAAISNMLTALSSASEEAVRDFINLDNQYNYEADLEEAREKSGEPGGSSRYPALVISKLADATGFGDYIDWSKQSFPVTKDEDLLFINAAQPYGELGYDLNGVIALEMSIPIFGAEIFRALTSAGSAD
ncbi:MAG: hypothetical protein AB1597_05570 [Chloroflexota bacterium]